MIRLLFFVLFLSFFAQNSVAQDHIAWHYSYNNASGNVEIKATIDEGWHLYSQNLMENAGPVATNIKFDKNSAIKLKSKVQEPNPKEEYDMNFESMVRFFEHEVVFTQALKIKKNTVLKGVVTYMLCNDVMCLPPSDQQFEIKLSKQ